jgi:hypothetical protein
MLMQNHPFPIAFKDRLTLFPSPDCFLSTSQDRAVKVERSEPEGTLDSSVARAQV